MPGAFFLVEAANLRVRGREGKVAVSGVFADELFVATRAGRVGTRATGDAASGYVPDVDADLLLVRLFGLWEERGEAGDGQGRAPARHPARRGGTNVPQRSLRPLGFFASRAPGTRITARASRGDAANAAGRDGTRCVPARPPS